jgi:hypothetical protein
LVQAQARDQSKDKASSKRGRPSKKVSTDQQKSKGGNLDASATKGTKPNLQPKDKAPVTPLKGITSFFKPISSCKKPTEDVVMQE